MGRDSPTPAATTPQIIIGERKAGGELAGLGMEVVAL